MVVHAGGCATHLKVQRVMQAGGLAVILCVDVEPGQPIIPPSAAGKAGEARVPCLCIRRSDEDRVRSAPEGVRICVMPQALAELEAAEAEVRVVWLGLRHWCRGSEGGRSGGG